MFGRAPVGFTLIELLIAVTVFAVMGTMAYGGLASVLESQQHARVQSQRLRSLQFTLRIMQRDAELAVERPVRDQLGDIEPAMRTASDPLLTLTQAGWPNPAGQIRSHLQRVAYHYENGSLYRLSWPTLDGATPADAQRTLLLDRVDAVEFRFLGQDLNWQTSWPPPAQLLGGATGTPSLGANIGPGAAPPAGGATGPVPGGAPGIPPGAAPQEDKANLTMPRAVEISFTAVPYGRIRRVFALAQ